MRVGDYVKVTMFRGEILDEPIWMVVEDSIDNSTHSTFRNWWSGWPLCGPRIMIADLGGVYDRKEALGMSSDGKPDRWEEFGSEPPDEFYAAKAKFELTK